MAVQYLDAVMVTYHADDTSQAAVIAAAAAEKGTAVLIKKALSSGHTPAGQVGDAIRFALSPIGVTSVVIGSRSPDNMLKNILFAI